MLNTIVHVYHCPCRSPHLSISTRSYTSPSASRENRSATVRITWMLSLSGKTTHAQWRWKGWRWRKWVVWQSFEWGCFITLFGSLLFKYFIILQPKTPQDASKRHNGNRFTNVGSTVVVKNSLRAGESSWPLRAYMTMSRFSFIPISLFSMVAAVKEDHGV